ncbi:MAG: CYCXC family (seleno)protein [Gemmatimonadaceae bacterium]
MRKQLVTFLVGAAAVAACTGRPPDAATGETKAQLEAALWAQPDASRPNAVLDAAQWDDPQVKAAYAAAKKYAHVLEQLYCYCHCKENLGHRALVECFETDHASMCDVCMTEAMTAARMTSEGKTPKEIQQAIDAYYRT